MKVVSKYHKNHTIKVNSVLLQQITSHENDMTLPRIILNVITFTKTESGLFQ